MIILDTHIFVWMNIKPEMIPVHILNAIGNESTLGLSAISLWEIAMLTKRERIKLEMPLIDWFDKALAVPKIKLINITPLIAATSEQLVMHGDPADRLIAATALESNCALATCDGELLKLPFLQGIK